MLLAATALALGEPSFYTQMNSYLDCLGRGFPADMPSRDLNTRIRIYRAAAARCQREREAAVEAAVRNRPAGTSEAEARQQAIDVIDTLDPTPRHYGR